MTTLRFTRSPFHWQCNKCEAVAQSNDDDVLFSAARTHHRISDHFDFTFYKEIEPE